MKLNAGVELVGEGLVYCALVHLREHVTCTNPNPSLGTRDLYQTNSSLGTRDLHQTKSITGNTWPAPNQTHHWEHVTCIKPTRHWEHVICVRPRHYTEHRDLHQARPNMSQGTRGLRQTTPLHGTQDLHQTRPNLSHGDTWPASDHAISRNTETCTKPNQTCLREHVACVITRHYTEHRDLHQTKPWQGTCGNFQGKLNSWNNGTQFHHREDVGPELDQTHNREQMVEKTYQNFALTFRNTWLMCNQ